MTTDAAPSAKRRGRPPASDSADTRRRILDTARIRFASSGYDSATNRALAEEVGITAGALYHYFGSKLDLYVAVNDDVWDRIDGRLGESVEGADGFVGKFEALLDTAHELNEEDPTLAAFVGSIRADMRRHPEIGDALGSEIRRGNDILLQMVNAGVANGEIEKEHKRFVIEYVLTILVGLTDGVSHDAERHQRTVDSIKMMLRGDLVTPQS
ncbi:MAG: TetR/AcrR family transcriptional regulator [Acidimicrobiia bacterium]|nr:TetR/AcrR family transcriptional regulator [Acidimicrobiia bacterium]